MDSVFLIAIATMSGLGLILAAGLAIADKKLSVEENPMIGKVNEMLPNANCGACGKAGCYDFAVNLVNGDVPVNGCPVGGADTAAELAELLGLENKAGIKMVPRVMCNGGYREAAKKDVEYSGPMSCAVATIVSSADKACLYGCLGGGDCVKACPFDALYMDDNGLPQLIEENCTACTLCVKACPKFLIEMHPIDRNLFVFCKNQDDPKTAKAVCKVACIGCGICAKKSDGAITMESFLAVVNHDSVKPEMIPVEKCPTKSILYLHPELIVKVEEVKETKPVQE